MMRIAPKNRVLLGLCSMVALWGTLPAHADRLVFMNGDRLRGQLVGSEGSSHLLWRVAPEQSPIKIPLNTLHKLEFLPNPTASTNTTKSADQSLSLTLSNGDTLLGELVHLGEDAIDLKSPDFGRLSIPRRMLGALNINDGGYFLLPDAGKAKDWFVDAKGAWSVKNGILTAKANGTLSRELPKAKRIRMDFEIRTDSENSGTDFSIHFFSSNVRSPYTSTHYALRFNGSYVNAMKTVAPQNAGVADRWDGIVTENLGEALRLDQALGNTPTRLTILADPKQGVIILQIAGKTAHTWNDEGGLDNSHGSAIGFTNNAKSTTITDLTVARWTGSMDAQSGEANLLDSGKSHDEIHLANDDILTGKVTGLATDKLALKADNFGDLAIPTERIVRIQLSSLALEQSRRLNGDVTAYFRTGGNLTLRLDEITPATLRGFSENCGTATLATPNIREIYFNLYEEKFPSPDILAAKGADALQQEEW